MLTGLLVTGKGVVLMSATLWCCPVQCLIAFEGASLTDSPSHRCLRLCMHGFRCWVGRVRMQHTTLVVCLLQFVTVWVTLWDASDLLHGSGVQGLLPKVDRYVGCMTPAHVEPHLFEQDCQLTANKHTRVIKASTEGATKTSSTYAHKGNMSHPVPLM